MILSTCPQKVFGISTNRRLTHSCVLGTYISNGVVGSLGCIKLVGAIFGIVILCYCWKDCYYCIFLSSNKAYMIAFDYLFLMRFYGTLIYDYVYVVMFDYVVQVGDCWNFYVWTYIINLIMS